MNLSGSYCQSAAWLRQAPRTVFLLQRAQSKSGASRLPHRDPGVPLGGVQECGTGAVGWRGAVPVPLGCRGAVPWGAGVPRAGLLQPVSLIGFAASAVRRCLFFPIKGSAALGCVAREGTRSCPAGAERGGARFKRSVPVIVRVYSDVGELQPLGAPV